MKPKKTKSQCMLFSDDSLESNEARKLLTGAGINFREVPDSTEMLERSEEDDLTPPMIEAPEGTFIGLSRIKDFVEHVVTMRLHLA